MVRTKADRVPGKVSGGKAPHKTGGGTPRKTATTSKGNSYSGGNPYHPRDTPEWQKPITQFFGQNSKEGETSVTGSSELKENQDQNNVQESGNESD